MDSERIVEIIWWPCEKLGQFAYKLLHKIFGISKIEAIAIYWTFAICLAAYKIVNFRSMSASDRVTSALNLIALLFGMFTIFFYARIPTTTIGQRINHPLDPIVKILISVPKYWLTLINIITFQLFDIFFMWTTSLFFIIVFTKNDDDNWGEPLVDKARRVLNALDERLNPSTARV